MPRINSILVATDLSPDANNAIRKAALLAERHSARLTMLHVVSPAGSQALRRWLSPSTDIERVTVQARATLRRFAKEILGKHGVAAKFDVVVGNAFDEILAGSQHADLVVVGERRTGTLKEFVVGGTVDRLLGQSRKPLLIVKRGNKDPYRQVLVPVDLTSHSEAALRAAVSLSQHDGAIHVFHARDSRGEFEMQMADVPAPVIREYREMKHGEARARLRELIAKVGVEARRVFAFVSQGDARRLILEHEKLLQADLVVAGKQAQSAMVDFLLGSVASRLLTGSKCDVLIIPRASTESIRAAVEDAIPSLPSTELDAASSALRASTGLATVPVERRACVGVQRFNRAGWR